MIGFDNGTLLPDFTDLENFKTLFRRRRCGGRGVTKSGRCKK